MAQSPWLLLGAGVLFFVALIVAFSYTVKALGSADTDADLQATVNAVAGTNAVLIFFMCIVSYLYIRANTDAFIPFTVVMLHANFLLALIAVSISALQKMS